MADSEIIFELLEELLSTINSVFEQELVELPERQYIAAGGAGSTVHDCEQLTVSLEQVYTGFPGEQDQTPVKCAGPRSAGIVVELVRCVPNSKATGTGRSRVMSPPTPEEQTESARKQAVDAKLLLDAALTFAQEQYYLGGLADVVFSDPDGGYQATILNLTIGVA